MQVRLIEGLRQNQSLLHLPAVRLQCFCNQPCQAGIGGVFLLHDTRTAEGCLGPVWHAREAALQLNEDFLTAGRPCHCEVKDLPANAQGQNTLSAEATSHKSSPRPCLAQKRHLFTAKSRGVLPTRIKPLDLIKGGSCNQTLAISGPVLKPSAANPNFLLDSTRRSCVASWITTTCPSEVG